MDHLEKISFVRQYFDRLTASDIEGIISMFSPDGFVISPYLGRMSAKDFFAKLGEASEQNKLTVFDVLVGEHGDSVAAHFEYDWTLASGDKIVFEGVDYFKLSDSGLFASLSIFYDTYPTRQQVGDKYG